MTQQKQGLNVSVKSYLAAIAVILVLMVGTYVLTFVVPGGAYVRVLDSNGNPVLDPGSFAPVQGGLPFWKWILSPVLLLGAEGGGMVAAIAVFLLVIGGVFNSLEVRGLMRYLLDKLVPIVVALAINLGWDAVTGLGMSLLAVGCGFASGVCNPFTVGVAQELAGLPMFSGLWLRLAGFVLIYLLLLGFLLAHAKKLDGGGKAAMQPPLQQDSKMDRGIACFGTMVGLGIGLVLCSGWIKALQDYTMIIVAVMFLAAGITACLVSGMPGRELARSFGNGIVSILPATVLILMASSIKYILTEARILDTLLYYAVGLAQGLPQWVVVLFIYLLVLGMNFFISSGSAKAFLLMPLIVPMAQLFGIEPQLCVLAFAFGDGFSNVFYPTNAALLIALGLVDVSYVDWVRYSWKFQASNLLLTSLLLLFGLSVGYA